MKNRNYNLDPELFYAIERRARLERSREMARLFALAVSKLAGLLRVTRKQSRVARHRGEVVHA
jgi:hypothetical protein